MGLTAPAEPSLQDTWAIHPDTPPHTVYLRGSPGRGEARLGVVSTVLPKMGRSDEVATPSLHSPGHVSHAHTQGDEKQALKSPHSPSPRLMRHREQLYWEKYFEMIKIYGTLLTKHLC